MQKILRKRVLREFRAHALRYFALGFLIVISIYMIVALLGAAETVIRGVEEHAEMSRVEDGEFAFVIGRSGAGKSTMIKLLLKELDANSGEVYVNGYDLTKLKKRKVPEFRRTIGVVFQDYRLIDTMTVYENIAFVLRVIDAPRKQIRKRVPYVMSLVGLQDKADCYPSELSGGEQQRCALARALVNDPALLIADEPTGNVDPELAYELVELLQGINACGTTILMVTHSERVASISDRIIYLMDGNIQGELFLGKMNGEDLSGRERKVRNWLGEMGW
jgi:cell division transport system ATP-binding protein